MTAYDADYASAAIGLGLPLISTDARLVTTCAAAGVPAMHLENVGW